jgi:hypothetical protein
MSKALVIAVCEICGLNAVFNFNAFHATGAVISWCMTCTPEQEYSKGDGGESPHHVVGSRLDSPSEVYTAWKHAGGSIPKDEAIAVAQQVCGGRKEYKDCSVCCYDPCVVKELFDEPKTCRACKLVANVYSDYCDFCEPTKKRKFNEALVNEAAGLHSEYDY